MNNKPESLPESLAAAPALGVNRVGVITGWVWAEGENGQLALERYYLPGVLEARDTKDEAFGIKALSQETAWLRAEETYLINKFGFSPLNNTPLTSHYPVPCPDGLDWCDPGSHQVSLEDPHLRHFELSTLTAAVIFCDANEVTVSLEPYPADWVLGEDRNVDCVTADIDKLIADLKTVKQLIGESIMSY